MESPNVPTLPTASDVKLKEVDGKKREETPEQEAMKKLREVAGDVENILRIGRKLQGLPICSSKYES